MRVLGYWDLKDKSGLLPLMYLAFGWPFNYEEFERNVKNNPRLMDGPVGFCALDNEQIVGFVGVMDLQTKNLDDEIEKVGGVWGVSTLPSHSRRGISTRLMERAHTYFKDKCYAFSFLNTSRSIIAYKFYQKLGYREATQFPSAFKYKGKEKKTSKKREKAKYNLQRILRIYRDFTAEKTGFVIRDEDYLRAAIQWEEAFHKVPEEVIFEGSAYAIFKDFGGSLCIDEIIAKKEDGTLIRKLEERAESTIYDRIVLDRKLLETYSALGYAIHTSSYTTLMFKPFQKYKNFKETYGDKFYMSSLDYF